MNTASPDPSPWLSILIPAYNVEEYLEHCVVSILDQQAQDIEIIICDDASTDGTLALANGLQQQAHTTIRVLQNEQNVGISATRNKLIDSANGTYTWFIDPDDFLLDGAITKIRDVIAQHSPDVIGCDYRKGNLYKRAFTYERNILKTDADSIVGGVCAARKMYVWLKVVKRSLWDESLRFPEGRVFEDAAIVPRLLLKAESYFHIGNALLHYRVRAGSVMTEIARQSETFNLQRNLDLAHALDGYAELLDQKAAAALHRTRFAVSHFIAMEFAKIIKRLWASDSPDKAATGREFRVIMDHNSPIGFGDLRATYLKHGRLIAWLHLSRAMSKTAS